MDVYIFDSGVLLTHREFEGRIQGDTPAVFPDGQVAGHGTVVAGVLAGATYGVVKSRHIPIYSKQVCLFTEPETVGCPFSILSAAVQEAAQRTRSRGRRAVGILSLSSGVTSNTKDTWNDLINVKCLCMRDWRKRELSAFCYFFVFYFVLLFFCEKILSVFCCFPTMFSQKKNPPFLVIF